MNTSFYFQASNQDEKMQWMQVRHAPHPNSPDCNAVLLLVYAVFEMFRTRFQFFAIVAKYHATFAGDKINCNAAAGGVSLTE
jgi:hypothetical protein